VEFIDVESAGSLASVVAETTAQKSSGIVLDVGSLKNACNQDQLREMATHFGKCEMVVLLLVSEIDESANRFLQALTNDAVRGVVSAG